MSESRNTYTCPVTKLTILNKPEWNRIDFGNEYKISADIIGEQILLTHSFGKPTLHDAQSLMHFTTQIIDQYFQNRPYIHIINYTEIKNFSLDTRRYVINELKSRNQMLAAIFYGLSPFLKLSVKIGRLFHLLPFTCLIAQDYTEAMESALVILNDSEKNPLIVEKKRVLNCETAKLFEELGQKKLPSNIADPNPLERAVELIEDEIQLLEEREDEACRQSTLARLDKVINSRNEKARIYWNSLRPGLRTGNKPDK